MKNIYTLLLLLIILSVNIMVLSLKDPLFITVFFISVCIVSIYLTSFRQIVARFKIFSGVALSLFVFQSLLVRSLSLEMLAVQSIRVAMQLFVVSEAVRVGIRYISPTSLISLFAFLPKQMQLLIAMTFYFIPLSMGEYRIIKNAQLSRGLGNSIKGKLIAPIAFIIPLLHRVFQRSEIMTYSILSRGWRED